MNDFLKILSREVDNASRIYLYPENGYWYAYEQSACRLKQVAGECCIQRVINRTYEVVLIRARISDRCLENELEYFLALSPGLLVCDTFVEIPLRWQSPVVFEGWKQAELATSIACVEFEKA